MAEVPIFQVDVFTSDGFQGNPAAVCPVPVFLDDETMQAIALQNNIAETAFVVPTPDAGHDFDLRWFTPNSEIDLCSHSTIAAAFVILNMLEPDWQQVVFNTVKGLVIVQQQGAMFSMTLPVIPSTEVLQNKDLPEAMGGHPVDVIYHTGNMYHLVYEDRRIIEALKPNYDMMKQHRSFGFIASARSETADFVCRCFYPSLDIMEDPVTVTAYRMIVNHWSAVLNKNNFLVHQLSERQGQLWLNLKDDMLTFKGEAVMVSQGSLYIPGLS